MFFSLNFHEKYNRNKFLKLISHNDFEKFSFFSICQNREYCLLVKNEFAEN